MAWRFISLAAVVLAGACQAAPESKEDTGSSAPAECTPGSRPRITDFSVERGVAVAEGPTLLVELSATDADGDLWTYQVDLWFDGVVDGAVDRGEDNHIAPALVTLDAGPCGAPDITSEIEIVLLGDEVLDYDTLYEFMAVLTDDAGLESPPAVTTVRTPVALEGS